MQRRIPSTPNCPEFSNHRSCSTTDCQQCGPRQTIVIGVETGHQFVKSATTAACHSMYLTKHQKTDSSSKNSKCLQPTRFVASCRKKLILVADCIFLMIMSIFGRDYGVYGVKGGFWIDGIFYVYPCKNLAV